MSKRNAFKWFEEKRFADVFTRQLTCFISYWGVTQPVIKSKLILYEHKFNCRKKIILFRNKNVSNEVLIFCIRYFLENKFI